MSGENKTERQGGMRSWGSPVTIGDAEDKVDDEAVPSEEKQANGHGETDTVEKKRKKKGDKGGTGTKANSKRPRSEADGDEPAPSAAEPQTSVLTAESKSKKRKREENAEAPIANGKLPNGDSKHLEDQSPSVPEKTLKRLRKAMGKLQKTPGEMHLAEWLENICRSKEKALDRSEVMRGLNVSYSGDRWVLRA